MTDFDCLRVMSFNVLQMDVEDPAQAWEQRRDLLVETIQLCSPDLLGAQEIHAEQTVFILDRIPSFNCFGRGRYGDDRDKHNTIFFDRQRFSLIDCGEKWFSRTPEIPGSSDWEIPKPRMVTWGRLRPAVGSDILILNTHLPYGRGADEARRQSTLVLLQTIATLPPELPLLLTGDFNAPAEGEVHSMLTGKLQDAWITAHETEGPEGTFHGFGRFKGSRRLDWILHRNTGETVAAETVTHAANGHYPSDHFPVCATFLLDPYDPAENLAFPAAYATAAATASSSRGGSN
jgi:endonuclease/exonuclease/phosphatase family metal-dependent hydrolase